VGKLVDAALQSAVAELNARRGGDALTFSIGLNMGEAVVGNVGTPPAMNYTAIGDVVNVAKRLQERAEPGQILASGTVIDCLGDLVVADKVGEVQVKSRKEPTTIYTLHGLA